MSGDGINELLVFLSHVSATSFTEPNFGGLLIPPQGACDPHSHAAHANSVGQVDEKERTLPISNEVEVWVTRVFRQVPGVKNPVLEGFIKSGQVGEHQHLWLGPDEVSIIPSCLQDLVNLNSKYYWHTLAIDEKLS